MKNLYYVIVLVVTCTLSAQTVKLKKEIVFIDNITTFSFVKKAMGNELYVYKINSTEELVNIIVDNNKTESIVDDSKKIVFSKQNTTIQSKNFRGRDWEFMLALLLSEKVIDTKGNINADNLKRFKAKYDDGNINHTMMR